MKLVTLGGLRLDGVDFGRSKPLLLLAYLAIEGPQARRHVAELFWHDASDPMASLRVALARLRKAAPDAIHDDEHRLATDVVCDATGLLEALDRASDREPPVASAQPFLDGLYLKSVGTELEEWIYGTREFIAQRLRGALLTHAERLAVRNDHARAATTAIAALDVAGAGPADPEDLQRAHPILASARHERARTVADELREYGLEPDTTTVAAEASRHDDEVPTNLTPPTTSFIGREAELRTIHELLAEGRERLITLLGTAGVGKTRLSIQAAYDALASDRYPDGVFWVGLDAERDVQRLGERVADALGFTPQGADPVIDQVTRYLANQRVLLVLDNYEQLIEGAHIPPKLIHRCPNLTLLVTSRERLNVAEEHALPVRGLPYPDASSAPEDALAFDAVQLFTIRAQRSRPDFRIDEHALPGVLRVCALVDGAPLGLELAAAWTRALPIDEIANELEASLEGLTALTRDVPERHQNLKAAFERSWQLLTEQERTVLRRLAVFRGGFRREGASAVAGATLPLLASLVDKSLLRLAPNGRYDRHPLVHQFSLDKLTEHPNELTEYRNRHGQFYVQDTLEKYERYHLDTAPVHLDRLRDELPNILAAWDTYLEQKDAESVAALAEFHGHIGEVWGLSRQGFSLMSRGVEALTGDDRASRLARGRLQAVLVMISWRLGQLQEGVRLAEEAIATLDEIEPDGDRRCTWWALQGVAACLLYLGRIAEALPYNARGYRLAVEAGPRSDTPFIVRKMDGLAGMSKYQQAVAYVYMGRAREALALAEEAVTRTYRSGPRFAAYTNEAMIMAANAFGDFEIAERVAREGLKHAETVGNDVVIIPMLRQLGRALFHQERYAEAIEVLNRAVERADRTGDRVVGSGARALLGWSLLRVGQPDEAAPHLLKALSDSLADGAVPQNLDEALLAVSELAENRGDRLLAARTATTLANLDGAQSVVRQAATRLADRIGAASSAAPADLDVLVGELRSAFAGDG